MSECEEENSTVSSATLISARMGDEEAWRSIWTRYSDRVFRQTLRFGIGTFDAEDITMEVFRKVWDRLQDFSRQTAGQSLGAWINRITQTTALDFLRKQQHAFLNLGSDVVQLKDLTTPEYSSDDSPSIVWLAIWRARGIVENESSDRAWDCFRLSRFAHLPHSEIAELLGMSVSNVSTTTTRILRKIREECIRQLEIENILVDQNGKLRPRDSSDR
jgi:RNA polymerase sigma-70 factor (ECF subfamily)